LEESSRLPVVHRPQYLARNPSRDVIATTARRGLALMVAGAIARYVASRVADRMINRATSLPAVTQAAAPPVARAEPTVVEEVVYYRRRTYRA
jgi:hypothetical protein